MLNNPLFRQIAGVALFLMAGAHSLIAQPPNLPVFTSPIDVTGLPIQIRAAAPDPNTGTVIDVALPTGALPGSVGLLASMPVSKIFDQYWAVTLDPMTNMTQRDLACTGPKGIASQIQPQIKQIGSGFSAYDVSCNLATTGQLLVEQHGSTMIFAYQLTANQVEFRITTPATCKDGHGTFLCPTDPRVTVHFAVQMIFTVRASGVCEIFADNATIVTKSVTIDGNHNLAGAVATAVDDLFLGHKFSAAERTIGAMQQQKPLPLDGFLKQVRDSAACTGANPVLSRTLKLFSDFETVIDVRQAIIFRATHPAIPVPSVQVPNPGVAGPAGPTGPTFTPPTISADRPVVQPGAALGVNGRFFPPNLDMSRSLPVTIGANSTILGGSCFGGGTDLQWGPVGQVAVVRLPGSAQVPCASSFAAANLTPSTAYQFSARNCDVITCSLFSRPVRVTTGAVNPNAGRVTLLIDGVTNVGSTILTAQGTFAVGITVPGNLTPGAHKLRAVDGAIVAETPLSVAAPAPAGHGTMMMVGVLNGEQGCPNHPITSTAADATFRLFGSGFVPGAVAIRLDTPTGLVVGNATVAANGTFCGNMNGVPGSQAGNHRLIAVQNGAVQAQLAAAFVVFSGPH